MLWLALHLPRLPLEVFPRRPPPSAIVSRERIVVADEAAATAGVLPGMRLSGAWALQPDLHVQQRDETREQAALAQLACWAGSFTSDVCLLPPQTLLLEVAGSLRLFGGAPVLFAAVVEGCREQGFAAQAALAPTPLAAQWLAVAGDHAPCLDPADLPRRLGALPLGVLSALNLSAQNHARLSGFGARSIGDVLRLPRAGLARRLGVAFVTDLARALGELPDPRARFIFPERFIERLELPARVDNALALGFAGRRLIAVLCGWLAARSGGISECVFEFEHERGTRQRPVTLLVIGLTGATRNAERIGRVLIERLHSLDLPAAVEVLTLRAESPEPLAGRAGSLFSGAGGGGQGVVANAAADAAADEAIAALVERLQARLGNDRVHGLAVAAEHRPENASQPISPILFERRKTSYKSHGTVQPASSCKGSRPLWLLPQPRALIEVAGRPQRGGPLQLLAGPERIESGWWDSDETGALGEVRRDYFVALSLRAEWLWVFRSEAGWFLHGVFA
jgi:protein ImuB